MGEEFQRVAVFPIGVGEIEEIAALGGAGIVDENVEPAELALDLFDQFCRRVRAAQIDCRDGGAAALLADGGCDLVERLFVAAGQHHVAALGRQRQRDAAADAAARSGHQRDLAFQAQVHRNPPCWPTVVAGFRLRSIQVTVARAGDVRE